MLLDELAALSVVPGVDSVRVSIENDVHVAKVDFTSASPDQREAIDLVVKLIVANHPKEEIAITMGEFGASEVLCGGLSQRN